MKAFGAALQKRREEAGISLDEIHKRTRINPKHILAIERGDFPSLPQTYVRAFLREYARSIGLDDDKTLEQYNALAEEIRGIPKPPAAIDHSHLTPKLDDSVEIIPDRHIAPTPKHVEVDGKPEVEQEDFVLPVRKSKYVEDGHKAVLLPSTSRTTDSTGKDSGEKDETDDAKEEAIQEELILPDETPENPVTEEVESVSQDLPVVLEEPSLLEEVIVPEDSGNTLPLVETDTETESSEKAQKPAEKKPEKRKKDKDPKKRSAEDEEQRRILVIGGLVTSAIVIGIIGIWYFSAEPTEAIVAADSTSVNRELYAERFIDSTDFIPEEPEIIPDTTTGAVNAPVNNQPPENVYALEDSLVLEAFSSTPVYFSIRMDTTKTEKGFLSSNEHRLWKAKDQFIISLGDAGAMTFFLNGKQLKSLGGEGLAINNHLISRKTLDQD